MTRNKIPAFAKVAENLKVAFDLGRVNDIPEITHVYSSGPQPKIPDELCWMTYVETSDVKRFGYEKAGSISFTRNTHKYLPEFTAAVKAVLDQTFPAFPLWLEERIHIIRTAGYIPPHIDEVRTCALNIGLHNSASATTIVSVNGREDDFLVEVTRPWHACTTCQSYSMQDGDAYLLDVSNLHAVSTSLLSYRPRYLITYGFGAHYSMVLKTLTRKSALLSTPNQASTR